MSFVARIGDAIQTLWELKVEWRVNDFSSLSEKDGDHYHSPVFSFADSLWYLELRNPDSADTFSDPGCVDILLYRAESGLPKTISCTLGYKYCDGVEKKEEEDEDTFFSAGDNGWGPTVSWSRAALLEQASRLLPDDVLTITCHLKCSEPINAKVSLSNRVMEVSRSMKTVLAEGKGTDFTLKLGDREWPVHKAILESRCEYFANMFRHDWVENAVGVVALEGVEEEVMDRVLNFVYCGDVEDEYSTRYVCEIYVAARKFLMDDLSAWCVELMKGLMCDEIVCKALVVADAYGEEGVRQSAIEYLVNRSEEIFYSEEWKEFKKDHPSIVAELFEETAKRERKKREVGRRPGVSKQRS